MTPVRARILENCPVCGSDDPHHYLRCHRSDCTDGRHVGGAIYEQLRLRRDDGTAREHGFDCTPVVDSGPLIRGMIVGSLITAILVAVIVAVAT
jgi:hypothetical protein